MNKNKSPTFSLAWKGDSLGFSLPKLKHLSPDVATSIVHAESLLNMDLFFLGSLECPTSHPTVKIRVQKFVVLLKSNRWQTSFGIMRWIDIFLLHVKKKTRKPITLSPQTNTNMWLGKVSFKWHFPVAGTSRTILVWFFCVWGQGHPGDQQKQCRSSVELSKGHWSFWALRASLVGLGGFWANKIWLRNGHTCRRLNWGRGQAEYLFVGGSIFWGENGEWSTRPFICQLKQS